MNEAGPGGKKLSQKDKLSEKIVELVEAFLPDDCNDDEEEQCYQFAAIAWNLCVIPDGDSIYEELRRKWVRRHGEDGEEMMNQIQAMREEIQQRFGAGEEIIFDLEVDDNKGKLRLRFEYAPLADFAVPDREGWYELMEEMF